MSFEIRRWEALNNVYVHNSKCKWTVETVIAQNEGVRRGFVLRKWGQVTYAIFCWFRLELPHFTNLSYKRQLCLLLGLKLLTFRRVRQINAVRMQFIVMPSGYFWHVFDHLIQLHVILSEKMEIWYLTTIYGNKKKNSFRENWNNFMK